MDYRTKQRDAILTYIQGQHNRYVTAAELAAYFKGQRIPIGMTTIYRHLEKLTAKGVLRKYSIEGSTGAKFKAVDMEEAFLLKCEMCGDLVRFRCEELGGLYAHFNQAHNFWIDPYKTVFYGRCDRCKERTE